MPSGKGSPYGDSIVEQAICGKVDGGTSERYKDTYLFGAGLLIARGPRLFQGSPAQRSWTGELGERGGGETGHVMWVSEHS